MLFSELLKIAIENPQILLEVLPLMDPNRFTDPFERRLIKETHSYYRRYKRIPSMADLDLTFRSFKNKQNPDMPNLLHNQFKMFAAQDTPGTRMNDRFIKDQIVEAIRNRAVKAFLTKAASEIESADNFKLEKMWNDMKVLVTSVQENRLGLAVHENIGQILEEIDETAIYNRIPTVQWKAFDTLLRGGVGREEILLFMAPSGKGKTTFLVNMAYLLMHNTDINVLSITTELRDFVFTGRLYRRILHTDRDTFKNMDKLDRQHKL